MDNRIQHLLRWYKVHRRHLPWRDTRDGYRIFISELMLQQTQVDRVIPKFHAFLEHFPSWSALAQATTPELIHAWAGLGYNRRALYARASAIIVIANGAPNTLNGWRALKGVGPYMAAALSEFVDHQRAIVIDTNVRRVAGRIWLGLPFPKPVDDTLIIKQLEKVVPKKEEHWNVPQAFMDLGSSICSVTSPQCAICPMQKECKVAKRFLNGTVTKKHRVISRPTERIHAEKKYPDRIYRGRILALLRKEKTINEKAIGPRIDETFDAIADRDWVHEMVERLVKDGLVQRKKNSLGLGK